MTQEELKTQMDMLWDDYNMILRSYYFANKPEAKAEFWDMRDRQRENIEEQLKVYWSPVVEKPIKPSLTKDKPSHAHNAHKITIKGRTQTLNEWAKESGINRGTLYYRLFIFGWDPEEAISAGKYRHKTLKKRTIPDKEYDTECGMLMMTAFGKTKPLKSWAKESKVHYKTLYSRIYHLGWPMEKALTTEKGHAGRPSKGSN